MRLVEVRNEDGTKGGSGFHADFQKRVEAVECPRCGALVLNEDKHAEFHENLFFRGL